jgi:hypothetical protein
MPGNCAESPEGVWIRYKGSWEQDPVYRERRVYASFLVFCSQGQFRKYEVTLWDNGKGPYLGPSDGFVEYHGTWKSGIKTLVVKYSFFDSMYIIYKIGGGPDRSEKSETVKREGNRIRFGNERYDSVSKKMLDKMPWLKCQP